MDLRHDPFNLCSRLWDSEQWQQRVATMQRQLQASLTTTNDSNPAQLIPCFQGCRRFPLASILSSTNQISDRDNKEIADKESYLLPNCSILCEWSSNLVGCASNCALRCEFAADCAILWEGRCARSGSLLSCWILGLCQSCLWRRKKVQGNHRGSLGGDIRLDVRPRE